MTLTTQFATMIAMIGMGSLFGASLDTYNRFLQRQRRKGWLVFMNDFLFWVIQGLAIFYVLFFVNQGELRFYIFVALLCGFAAYQGLFKRLYLRLLEWMISVAKALARFAASMVRGLIIRPVQFVLLTVLSLLGFSGKGVLSLARFMWRVIFWMARLVLKPFKLLLKIFWRLLPKKIKKSVERIYNKIEGYFLSIKKYTSRLASRIKSMKK